MEKQRHRLNRRPGEPKKGSGEWFIQAWAEDNLQHLGEIVVASVAWLLLSLPVITVGPATVGVFHYMALVREGRERGIIDIFRGMKTHFGFGIVLSLLFITLVFFLLLDIGFLAAGGSSRVGAANLVFVAILTLAAAGAALFLLPALIHEGQGARRAFLHAASLLAKRPGYGLRIFVTVLLVGVFLIMGVITFPVFYMGVISSMADHAYGLVTTEVSEEKETWRK